MNLSRMPEDDGKKSVELHTISKAYGEKKAVDDVTLDVREGEFLTLLGPSGCGKTSLLMMIAGFVSPTSGDISAAGRDITDLPPERRNFGMVFQGYALFPHLNVRDNIAYPLRRRGLGRETISTRVQDVLTKVQLAGLETRFPRELSGGQQQRVALARAIVFRPDLVLLDEPLSALDASLRSDLQVELRALHRETGMTFVCVTHDQDEALSMSDRIAVMNGGRIAQVSSPHELFSRPKNKFVATFMGAKNILAGEVISEEAGNVRYRVGGEVFAQERPTRWSERKELIVALRPHNINVDGAGNQIAGRVKTVSYLGIDVILTTETTIGTLTSRHPADERSLSIREGDQIELFWSPSDGIVVDAE